MPRRSKSQWDFGELFQEEKLRTVLTVTELTGRVQRALESQVGAVWVSGEVSNLRLQPSGHCYFTLKDANAQLNCVLFRHEGGNSKHLLEDGREVTLNGNLTVYQPRGQYQLRVTKIELKGVGALQLAFEKLKSKLDAEGLFDPSIKKALPRYPSRLGIITSTNGAALRDVLHVLNRRFPALEIILVPVRVQGKEAAGEIAQALDQLNQWSDAPADDQNLDLVLLTRGGGSLEDLWPFNEEIVARAIHASHLPVISAVGHEIDFTISDFAADVRAATPSAAAEIITEHLLAARQFVDECAERLPRLIRAALAGCVEDLEHLQSRLQRVHPVRRIQTQSQRLDELYVSLRRAAQAHWKTLRSRSESVFKGWSLSRPSSRLHKEHDRLTSLRQRLSRRARESRKAERRKLDALHERLRLLSPLNTLARGYSITRDQETGDIIRSVDQPTRGEKVTTRVRDGEFTSTVD